MSGGALAWAPILYWFRGQSKVPDEYEPVFRRRNGELRFTSAGVADGPEPKAKGLLVSPFDQCAVMHIPRMQRWDRIDEAVYIGADGRATPDLFLRDDHRGGRTVRLADGHEWVIPVANPMVRTCSLPTWDRLTYRRTWERVLQDQWADLGQRAADFAAMLRERIAAGDGHTTKATVDEAQARALVADALAVNYYVSVQELSVLRVFSVEACTAALFAIIDWEAVQEAFLADLEAAGGFPFGDAPAAASSPSPSGDPG